MRETDSKEINCWNINNGKKCEMYAFGTCWLQYHPESICPLEKEGESI